MQSSALWRHRTCGPGDWPTVVTTLVVIWGERLVNACGRERNEKPAGRVRTVYYPNNGLSYALRAFQAANM